MTTGMSVTFSIFGGVLLFSEYSDLILFVKRVDVVEIAICQIACSREDLHKGEGWACCLGKVGHGAPSLERQGTGHRMPFFGIPRTKIITKAKSQANAFFLWKGHENSTKTERSYPEVNEAFLYMKRNPSVTVSCVRHIFRGY